MKKISKQAARKYTLQNLDELTAFYKAIPRGFAYTSGMQDCKVCYKTLIETGEFATACMIRDSYDQGQLILIPLCNTVESNA